MKEIEIKVSPLIAGCLQRMITEEISNQEWWKSEDKAVGNPHTATTRDLIIKELNELSDDLDAQGITKYIKCN